MIVTRHISIDDEHVEKMKPYLDKHNGNFGAAIREMINKAGKYGSRTNSSAIDISLFNWILTEIEGILVPDDILDRLINPMLIHSIGELESYLRRRFSELEWDVDFALKYDNDNSPSYVLIELKGATAKIKFIALILFQYLVKNSSEHAPLGLKSILNSSDYLKIELSRSNKKDAQRNLITFFGGMDGVIKTIKSCPVFWKAIISRHVLSDYSMITVHRNYFEDLIADKMPLGEITIETLAKKSIQEIPLKEMLSLIKEIYEISRIVDRVDIDKDTITVSHNYRNKDAIERLKKIFLTLLEANGHLYDAKSAANMIVLMHRPDAGIKVNEIVSNLKTSDSGVDQELILFMAFLKGLKDIPDVPLSLTFLGRKIGRSLMQEYEKENNIKNWSLETFQKAQDMIDSKLCRVGEWKLDGKNLIYTIRKCNIAAEGGKFDIDICHTIREAFKGAMSYAFGNKAELYVKQLLSYGDKFCEVVIRKQEG